MNNMLDQVDFMFHFVQLMENTENKLNHKWAVGGALLHVTDHRLTEKKKPSPSLLKSNFWVINYNSVEDFI